MDQHTNNVNKRSYTEMQHTNNTQSNHCPNIQSSKRAKPAISPPSISISTSTSHSTPSSSTSTSSIRRDLFDGNLDETFGNTEASSTIMAPTLGKATIEKEWRDKTERALQSFQRRKKTDIELQLEQEPNNPIMKILVKISHIITDENQQINLQTIVLSLIYSSQSQQKQLFKSRNRYNRNRRNNDNNNNNNLYRYDMSWYDRLPGPQPHSITRTNLDRLRSYYYWVAEKSDGIRFMIFITNQPSFECYLVDRKFHFYQIKHPFYKKYLSDVNGASLMDGELIINESGELEYLIFDCIAMYGRSFSNECTSNRVEQFQRFVKKYLMRINEYIGEYGKTNNYESIPMVIRAKKHYKAQEIDQLLNCIQYSNGEYYFENNIRRTKNDGLIFTPQENNYLMSYDPGALVKWKFLEKNTIDLKVKTPYIWRGKLDLYAGGKGQSSILFTQIDMNNQNNRNKFNLLLNEMKRLSNHRNGFVSSFIIECAWNFKYKQWELVQNRPDKHIPNFITVCTDTLRVMMDNVTKNELIDACKPIIIKPSQNYQSNYGNNYNYR